MKFMGCIAWNGMAVVSTLLCVATLFLWRKSCTTSDHIGRLQLIATRAQIVEHRTGLFSGQGRLTVGWGIVSDTPAGYVNRGFGSGLAQNTDRIGWFSSDSIEWFHQARAEDFFADFGSANAYGGAAWNDEGRNFITVPIWFVLVFFAAFPIIWCMAFVGYLPRRRLSRTTGLTMLTLISFALTVIFVQAVGLMFFLFFRSTLFAVFAFRPPTPPARGICRFCGYDLRATPRQCSECGAVPSIEF